MTYFSGVALFAAAALAVSRPASADIPDIRGASFVAAGTIRLGGTVQLIGAIKFDIDVQGQPFAIVADPDNPDDATKIVVQTKLPFPDTPCNATRDFSINLVGTIDPGTGEFHVKGVRAGSTIVDSGQVYDFGIAKYQLHATLVDFSVTLNGTATVDDNGVVTLTGSDELPPDGGPSTNITVSSAKAHLLNPGECDISRAIFNFDVSDPYGGFKWSAVQQ